MSDPSQTPQFDPYGNPVPAQPNPYTDETTQAYGAPQQEPTSPLYTAPQANPYEQPTQTYPAYNDAPEQTMSYGQPPVQPTPGMYGGEPAYGAAPQQQYEDPYASQGMPPAMYPPQGTIQQPENGQWNTMVVVGFILSFFTGFIGSIVSALGLSQIKKTGEKSRGMAIAGIIIGIVMTIAAATGITIAVVHHNDTQSNNVTTSAPSESSKPDKSQGSEPDAGTDEPDNTDPDISDPDIDDPFLDDDDTGLGNDGDLDGFDMDSLKKGMTIEDVFDMPQVKSELESQMAEMPEGMDLDMYGTGNTLHVDIMISDDSVPEAAYDMMPSFMIDAMEPSVSELCDQLGITDGKIQVDIKDAAGKVVASDSANL